MKSIDERLADSNPVVHGYVPANYDQIVTRAMSQPRLVDSAWKRFRLRMAGSVAAASALTVLGVSVLNGAGAALPVLGFSAAATSPSPTAASVQGSSGVVGGTMMPIMLNYTFTGADNFSKSGGSAPVYALSAPSDLAATLNGVATSLGVTLGTTVGTSNSGSYFSVSGTGYSGSVSSNGGSHYWNIYATPNGVTGASGSAGSIGTVVPTPTTSPTATTGSVGATGSTGPSGATGPVAATGSLATRALRFVRALGDYSAGRATQSVSGGVTSITVPLIINGYPSGMNDSFNFNSDGTLQSASGSTFTLSSVATYPMISESAGVGQITAQESLFRHFIDYGAVTPTASSSASPQALSAPVNVKMSAATTGPSGSTGTTGTTGVSGTSVTTTPEGTSGSTGTTTSVPNTSGVTGASGASGPSGASGASGSNGTTTTTVLPTPTLVNLTAVTVHYASYEMKGGVWMELPVYDYTGTVVKGGYQVGFNVVPLPAQYLDFAPTVLPLGAR